MKTLESIFEERLHSDINKILLSNLTVIVAAHDDDSIQFNKIDTELNNVLQYESGIPLLNRHIIIDRQPDALARLHNLDISILQQFAKGKPVLDVGAGRSTFLDSFRGSTDFHNGSETYAVDINLAHLDFQSIRGHGTYYAKASDLEAIKDESITLLHAAYSEPYWSASQTEAAQTAREYTRVLKIGGIALISPIMSEDVHLQYEHFISTSLRRRRNHRGAEELSLPGNLLRSHIWSAFSNVIMQQSFVGSNIDTDSPQIEIVGTRTIPLQFKNIGSRSNEQYVPNYLMMRRIA